MDYERIQKPQATGCAGGGLSPGKLRNMLLGSDKRRREVEDLDPSGFNLRSQLNEANESGDGSLDTCKDVDMVVLVNPDCTTSMPPELEMRAEKIAQRVPVVPFSKPLSSKWDDAQKWIASPTSNRASGGQPKGPPVLQNIYSRKMGLLGYSRQPSLKIVVEVPEQKAASLGEPDTKRVDTSQSCKDSAGQNFAAWQNDQIPAADCYVSLSQHESVAVHSATAYIPPASTARSVSMRDMGTEMTPIASQEPSRTGTPVKATTPTRSPNSSRPSTPPRNGPSTSHTTFNIGHGNEVALSEDELSIKTRREIMALGQQLGKKNIAAWASKEDENSNIRASTSVKSEAVEPSKSAIEARAVAWEEAEKAKYMARFKREEMKIQAWENHQKAKTEAEMRKIEVEIERLRGRAHDTHMNKLSDVKHKAEEKRAAAEARRNKQAIKTEQQADHIRRTGRIPSSFSLCSWCF
ncbi:hypothetical protein MLD38_005398 [Melastoma candidum]|uniref:Uncharacterized protein n=1 Tax=Melastoma candidum TaxID=119954 RepID=A0ACB9RN72_9MYRT|nr:hypothetical protein MLD38_005398 [Melastoma candidum]